MNKHYTYMSPYGTVVKESSKKSFSLILDEDGGINYVPSKRFVKGKEFVMGYPVRAVYKNGAANKAGIREGDTIVKVDNRAINRPVDLSSALKWKRPGHQVSVRVYRDGTYSNLNVVLGSTKKSGRTLASLGVIHRRDRADAYKAKLAARKAKKKRVAVLDASKPTAQDLSEDLMVHTKNEEENHFMKQAKEEMANALALMEDMKGADALKSARELRAALRKENLRAIEKGQIIVNKHLNALKAKRIEEEEAALGDVVLTESGELVHRKTSYIAPVARAVGSGFSAVGAGIGAGLGLGARATATSVKYAGKGAWILTKAAVVLATVGGLGYGAYTAYGAIF